MRLSRGQIIGAIALVIIIWLVILFRFFFYRV